MTPQGKNITTVIVVAVVIVAAYFGYKYYTNRNNTKVSGRGTLPTAEDEACASGGTSTNREIVGICTKPILWTVPKSGGFRQKCFTSTQLNLAEGESGPDKVTENNGFGDTWLFNFQSGDRFCYVNKFN